MHGEGYNYAITTLDAGVRIKPDLWLAGGMVSLILWYAIFHAAGVI